MIDREPGAGSTSSDTAIPEVTPERYRQRVVVRRRRPGKHRRAPQWSARRGRKHLLRTFAVSAGVLLIMALALYFGLARQEAAAPADGASHAKRTLIAYAA
jgi:hypothetical protein